MRQTTLLSNSRLVKRPFTSRIVLCRSNTSASTDVQKLKVSGYSDTKFGYIVNKKICCWDFPYASCSNFTSNYAQLPLQSELKRAVANTRRGKSATIDQQKDILRRVEALEVHNPTKDPATSPLISGKWSLLYTGAHLPCRALSHLYPEKVLRPGAF